jgi:hypothetical protein
MLSENGNHLFNTWFESSSRDPPGYHPDPELLRVLVAVHRSEPYIWFKTTNHDTLLDDHLGLQTVNWNKTDNVKMFFSPAQPRHLFHNQGTYSHPASVVFSCNDYPPLADQQINAPVIEPLQRLLQNYTVLFIGCGETTTDQRFSEVFNSLRSDSARSRHAVSSSARGRHSRAPAPESDLNPSATRLAGAMTSRSSPSFSPGPRGLSRP